jgi:glycosyltransferase involved in cell wall biosynthesis
MVTLGLRRSPEVPGEFVEGWAPFPASRGIAPQGRATATSCAGRALPARGSSGRLTRSRQWLKRLSAPKRKQTVREDRYPVIALVTDAIFPYHCGGREIRYHELSRRLAERAELHLYTMHWWDGPRRLKDGAVVLHGISRLYPMYTRNRRSLRQAIFFALACVRLLAARFDVLEADHMPLLQILVLRIVATVKRKRFVVTWHEVWGHSYWRQYLGLAGLIAWFIEYLAMRLPDHIIAASSHTAERLRAQLGPRASITVAPNGIDLDTVRQSYPHHAATDLVVVSRLMPHKRIGMLLDAVALLHAEGLPVTCRVIGDGPELDDLKRKARGLALERAVEFWQDVREQKEIYELVKASKVFVLPSAREGFGIAVLEALACGVPVVTTSSPDNLARHLVARSVHGIICDPTASAIADAVKLRLADPDSSAGRHASDDDLWLAEYNWEAMANRVMMALQI